MRELLDTHEAARYAKISRQRLSALRHFGGGPRYIAATPGKILYDRADLDAWLNGHRFANTSEASARRSREPAGAA